jgi:gamma-glutamyl hercynylcysteine S-oxide synthase
MLNDLTLRKSLLEARDVTDALFGVVRSDSLYERPIPERNRIIFYLGHLEAFDWNMVCRAGLDVPSFDPQLDRLFAFGIDPPEGQLPNDQPSDWPSIEQTQAYNLRVREKLDAVWENVSLEIRHVAVEHRLMHAETFAYMLHKLPAERKLGPPTPEQPSGSPPPPQMVEIPAGVATLGRQRGSEFGWDNEFEELTVDVPAFAIGRHKVTNGEYLEFVREGAEAPQFWTKRNGGWFLRRMFDEIPLPQDWPVYVTRAEADAYARWKGRTLPNEAQFHRAAYGTDGEAERPFPWGEEWPNARRGNFDFQSWDPVPVTATPGGDSAFGVSQLVGNGWEWTSTVFEPFPGFEPYPFYPGYSANFFDGEHYVIKGGSSRTAARLLRRTFRNWFRPRYPFAYAGFRLAEG